MKKKIFAICSVIAVAIVLIAVLVPSCTQPPAQCTIDVKATLDGSAWTGAVQYTLTGSTGASSINGTEVEKRFTVDCGSWTCAYVSGGPAGASFVNITPAATQSVSNGGTITFTLNFIRPQVPIWDASIEFVSWTIDGVRVAPGTYRVPQGTIVDIEYKEHVSGEEDAVVTVRQTNWLRYHYKGANEWTTIHAVNAWGAVTMSPPADKISQMTTVGGQPAPFCTYIEAIKCQPVLLDVETEWELVVCVDYTKSINWIRFGGASPLLLQDGLGDVLFEAMTPEQPVLETITLSARACVELDGDENPDNDCADWCPELTIEVQPLEQPQ